MIIFILIVLGLCFGSFITALIWRIHEQAKTKVKSSKLSIIHGRSMCENCKHVLMPFDLIPIFSWLILRGKCRYCHKPISIENPIIELTTVFLFIFSYFAWPYHFKSRGITIFIIWLMLLVCFIALTIYDLKWKLLPNRLVFAVVFLVFFQFILKLCFFNAGSSFVLHSIYGVALTAGLFYLLFIYSRGKWIGGGDVKLAVGLGLLIGGPLEAILMLFGASLIGLLISLPLLFSGKLKVNTKIPFGPMLMIATTICYFYGQNIINWYSRTLIK